ncbi:probable serine/threonine-protein kinase cdc7 [Drosophila tropicalis]|uniref:probable serine/threonine-protein kinase cdc7 n=1 Tax=Drosophila tropicalis TaxID=46794 RepID=UPI0035AC00E5
MQLKVPKSRIMASLKDEEETPTTSTSTTSNSTTSNINNCNNHTQQKINNSFTNNNNNINNNNDDDLKSKRDVLEARKHALESRLSENSWLLQQIQKQETAIINGNYEYMTIDELFKQLAQQYKNEQQLQAHNKEMQAGSSSSSSILRRKQSTTSRESRESQQTNSNYSNNINNNNNRQSETLSNRSSEYDNYQPSVGGGGVGGGGDMLIIGVAQSQQQQPPPLVKSALKKRPTPTPNQMQFMRPHYQQQMTTATYTRNQMHSSDVMYSANSSNVATLRQPPQVAPQQQPIIVQCDKYYLSPTHQSYTEGGFIKSSQNIKKYVSPMSSPRQLDAISLAPSYISVEIDPQQQQQHHHHQQQQQYRWRSQSHIAYPPLTPPPHHVLGVGIIDVKSQSSDMLASNRYAAQSGEDISSIEKKPKPKQWLESSLDGPAVIRQLETPHSPAALSTSAATAAGNSNNNNGKPTRVKLSSQSMSVAGAGSTARHYSMSSNQRPSTHHSYPSPSYAINTSSKALLSQSTSYLNAMEQTIGISASYPLEPLDIPAFRNLPPKPNQMQQPTPPPRPPPVNNNNNNNNSNNNNNNNNNGPGAVALSPVQTALVSPPLAAATAVLSPDIRIESPKNMTVVQQATFQPYKEVTKPFEMSDFYKYSTKFKQKEGSIGGRPD